MADILTVNHLSYHYGAINALTDVSFSIREGEIVTLIGSNGAGKTTMLRAVSGLLDPSGLSGEIQFMGNPIQKQKANRVVRKGLVQVLEGRHIFPRLTVEENLNMGAYLRKDRSNISADKEHVFGLFPRLKERKKQEGGTLSGGEQQMLAIARAMMSRPKLIMLDEPSLGLAPIIVTEIFETIRRLNNEGMTILLIEQNCNIALNTAQRGYVLETGSIILEDECCNLLENELVQKSYMGVE